MGGRLHSWGARGTKGLARHLRLFRAPLARAASGARGEIAASFGLIPIMLSHSQVYTAGCGSPTRAHARAQSHG